MEPHRAELPISKEKRLRAMALSLMAGEVASLLLSRMTVPILFYLSERKKQKG